MVEIQVTSVHTGEQLYHANVLNHRTDAGSTTDIDGRISIDVNPGDSIKVSYVGYRDTLFVIESELNFYSIPLEVQRMKEVVIFGEEPFNRMASQGRHDVQMEFLGALPAFNGDPDIIKSITFLPGVTGGKDGYSHLFVRGGDQDENLILLDGAPLYNVNHFGGFISMVHSDMIQSVDFYKGYWPSRFGGRLSSVLDIQSKSGNYKEHSISTDLSPLSVKTHISGPIWKDKVSYILGGRRTFIDLILLRNLMRKTRQGERGGYAPLFTFYDLNGKMEARLGKDQILSLSAFRGSDVSLYFENDSGTKADNEYNILNQNYALNYSWYINPVSTLKAHISSSYYRHFFEDHYIRNNRPQEPNIQDWATEYRHTGNTIRTLKTSIRGHSDLNMRFTLDYGIDHETLHYSLYLKRESGTEIDGVTSITDKINVDANRKPAYISSIFADGQYAFNDQMRIKAGIRIPRYQYDNFVTWMYEPKILLSYDLTTNTTVNANFNRQRQFSHLLSYTEPEGYFREFYTTSDAIIPPSLSHQWSVGWFHHMKNGPGWLSGSNISIELFYKRQSVLNKFIPGIDPDKSVVLYEDHILKNGTAQTYGAEFLFQKTAGKFHTSLSYTYAHSQATFQKYNAGKPFNSDFDYRHNINILMIYKFRKGYKLSAQWDYRSGRPFTLSTSVSNRDEIFTGGYPTLTSINNSRMPPYHRLDLSLDREWLTKRKGNKQWFGISIYNAYNHVNPFFAYPSNGKLTVTGFIPIIPSFHFGFEL